MRFLGAKGADAFKPELEFPKLLERSRVHAGLLIALALALGLWAIERFGTFGFALRAVGANARAARFAGLPVSGVTLGCAAISGALAGLAGVGEVAGRASYLTLDMSPGYGYAGIVIAIVQGVTVNFDAAVTDWSSAHNPFFGGASADLLSLVPFGALCGFLYFVAREKLLTPKR